MPRNKLITALNLCALLALAWYFAAPLQQPPQIAKRFAPPDINFTDIGGTPHRLSDFKGRPILLHFWATWCPPCVKEFPQLIALAEANPHLVIIAVSVDESADAIRDFLRASAPPKNFITVQDRRQSISQDSFQTVNYPETILIGCDYTMHDKVIGPAEDWATRIEPLLAECKP